MDYAQMKQEKEARYKEYTETYADQLQLMGYISSLEKDNEHIFESAKNVSNKGKRRAKKLTGINNKDIKKYKKALSLMPEVPEFK